MSLPSRERGLKFSAGKAFRSWERVAPLAGAWIEISLRFFTTSFRTVAPLAGAWIEIISCMYHMLPGVSLPSRERGLKLQSFCSIWSPVSVAPLAGAWIEILLSALFLLLQLSLPSRERGLKFRLLFRYSDARMSLPSRERGLKYPIDHPFLLNLCRSPRGSVD